MLTCLLLVPLFCHIEIQWQQCAPDLALDCRELASDGNAGDEHEQVALRHYAGIFSNYT